MPKEFENLNEESFQNESGNLKQTEKDIAERDDYLRDQEQIRKSKDTVHLLFIIWLWILFGASVILFLIWFWHLVVPLCWRGYWLKESQIDKIEKILIMAGGCAFVVDYLRACSRKN